MMLNQTSAKQVKNVCWKFFDLWSTPEDLIVADLDHVKDVISSLGFKNKRAKALVTMSCDFLLGFRDVMTLYGVGKYASDSYKIFIDGRIDIDVDDKELKKYVSWAKEVQRGRCEQENIEAP